jgi:regulator of sigma E protease
MSGENFSELSDAAAGTATVAPIEDPGALTSHPRWQQMLIGVAGPVANFILAFVLMAFYYNFINEVPSIQPIVVEWVSQGSAASQAGIAPGDIVRSFASVDNPSLAKIEDDLMRGSNQPVPLTVERDGKRIPLTLSLGSEGKRKRLDASKVGLFLQLVKNPIKIDSVVPDAPAARAGLRGGDLILAMDGHAFHTLDPMVDYLQAGNGKPVTLTVSRNGQTIAPVVVNPSNQNGDSAWRLGFTYEPPVDIPTRNEPMPFFSAVAKSQDFCVESSSMIFGVLKGLFTHKVSMSQLSGPVGIARMAGDAAESKGWTYKIGLAAMISLNLGVLNLLPFPILDGGMILFLLIESVIRRNINIDVKERIYQGAFVMLIAFFAFVLFNDVSKLPIFTHLKP